jgi:hypothetical protein
MIKEWEPMGSEQSAAMTVANRSHARRNHRNSSVMTKYGTRFIAII